MWLGANMQSESSSCITGVCVLFVYLVFTKGTHHITEVTAVCLKRAGAGARGERGCGESAMPSLGCCCLFCFLSFFFFLLSFFILSFFFFLFSFLFFFGGWQILTPRPFRTVLLLWVGSLTLICYGISVCMFACQAVLPAGGSEGSALPPCQAASACP